MTDTPDDVGDLLEVAPDERLDTDAGEGANALEGGADDDLADVYADPGDVVDLEEAGR